MTLQRDAVGHSLHLAISRWLVAGCVAALCIFTFAEATMAQVCAIPGQDGPATLSGVINTYYPGTATVNAGATSISIGASTGAATPIAIGDLLLVIQMQDAGINSTNTDAYGDGTSGGAASGYSAINNTGRYEYVVATSTAGASVSIRGTNAGGLLYTYTSAAASATQGQRRFQVVRVPQYSTATLSSSLTAAQWNGTTGGILAFDVTGNLSLGGATVGVTGLGFRGGAARQLNGGAGGTSTDYVNVATNNFHGGKAEGIAGTPRYVYDFVTDLNTDTGVEGYPNGSTARGAPGNAGGGGTDTDIAFNQENSGGGGGGNGGAGGIGGKTWQSNLVRGGYGGVAFASVAAGRVVLGGGGGGATRNNSSGTAGSGGSGGGIVLIRAGTIAGSATITANGRDGNDSLNDGGGGGGAGGSVVVIANSGSLGSLTINARGGQGGDAWPLQAPNGNPGERHGPGGGGGGGFIAITSAATTNITGGANGITTTANDAYGAAAGSAGSVLSIVASIALGANTGSQCTPTLTTTKTSSTASVNNSPTGTTATYTILIANAANRGSAINLTASDTLPAGFTFSTTGTVTLSGSATRPTTSNPTAGDAVPVWGSFTIPGGGSVSLTFTVNIAAAVTGGTYQNPATATYSDPVRTVPGGTATASYSSASSTGEDVTVVASPNVALVKTVTPSTPQSPGADLVYSIAFTNSGGRIATNLIVVDPIPANTDFKIGSMTSALGTTGLTVTVSYSNNNGTTWTYVPVSGAGGAAAGYDRTVTNVRWSLTGNLSQTAPNNNGTLGFTVQIR